MGSPGDDGYQRVAALIVDDEEDLRLLVRLAINAHNQGLYLCGEARSGAEAIELLAERSADVVVLDQMMPGMSGLETAARILERNPDQRIVLFSAFIDAELERVALRSGITRCLRKDRVETLPKLLIDLATA